MNNKIKIFLPIVLISSAAFVLSQVKNDTALSNNSFSKVNLNDHNSTDETNTNISFQKLTIINDRCRGCGRCVQIDPEHFEIDNRTALVISSTNLSSSALQLAINNCPTQAINLE